MLTIYNYDPITKEYTNEGLAQENPLVESEYLIPAHSTKIKPIDVKEGYAVVWSGSDWQYKEDHRGETWFNGSTLTLETVDFIGELPNYYYAPDSPIAQKPEGEYWEFDTEKQEWFGNPTLYKMYVLDSFSRYWELKLNTPFTFEGFRYLPAWRELYTSIWVALKDGLKEEYRLQDCDSKYNTVNKETMKPLITKMSDINDQMYVDKQNLEKFFMINNNFEVLQKEFETWLSKTYE